MPPRRSRMRRKGQPRRVADRNLLLKNTRADVTSGKTHPIRSGEQASCFAKWVARWGATSTYFPLEAGCGEIERGWKTMTEAAGGGRAEMERRLFERSLQDESFRQRLLKDPKATVE